MERAGTNVSVLIVDDDEGVRTSVSKALRTLGYAVTACRDGREACEALERSYFDVALVDLVMPRINGWETVELVTREAPLTRVVLFTGEHGQGKFADAAGASALVEKPVEILDLCELVSRLASEGAAERVDRFAGRSPLQVIGSEDSWRKGAL